jgi:HD-GYP domain-containing protein (c-di-GMP phosphodiesterase class II)
MAPDGEGVREETHTAQAEEIQRLRALVGVSDLLRRETDPLRMLEGLLKMAQDIIGAEAGFCLMFDAEADHLGVAAAVGRGADRAGRCRVPVAGSIEGAAAAESEPARVNDLAADPRAAQSLASRLEFPVRNLLCVPLCSGGEAYGVVELVNSARPAGFKPEEAGLLEALTAQATVAVRTSASVERLRRAFIVAVECLTMAFDTPAAGVQNHPQRVAPIARGVAEALALSRLDCEVVVLAVLLHDVGKIALDQQLLQEPRQLTERERVVVRSHPLIAAQFLEPLTDSHLAAVVPALKHHHEWVDGRGYPDGLEGDRVPIASRILAVVHGYCAMTEGRPYQPPKTAPEAIEELRRWAGSQFDPQVVEALVSVVSP